MWLALAIIFFLGEEIELAVVFFVLWMLTDDDEE